MSFIGGGTPPGDDDIVNLYDDYGVPHENTFYEWMVWTFEATDYDLIVEFGIDRRAIVNQLIGLGYLESWEDWKARYNEYHASLV